MADYSNLVNPPPGPQQSILNQMFATASPNVGKWLNNYASGVLPQPLQDQIVGRTNENFGRLGARFGTDLGTAISRGLGQAGANQSQWAIGDILGLGGTTAGFEFQGVQNSLDRALKEYLGNQQSSDSLLNVLLPILLGGGA